MYRRYSRSICWMNEKVILQNQKSKNVRGHPVQVIGITPSSQSYVTDEKTIILDNYRFWLTFSSDGMAQ